MDAAVRLALMAKAKNVFESDDTFLSFPALSPLTKSKDWFHLASGHGMTDPELTAASEFARIVNGIPDGVLFDGTSEERLWDVYADVLARATVAGGSLSPEEEAARSNAAALLYTTAPDGSQVDSPQLRTYKECRDGVITAQEELRNAEATAEAAGDAAHTTWLQGEGATLRGDLTQREQDWATRGAKDVVEAALRIEETLAQKGAGAQWTEWRNSFDPKIDLLTDLDKQSYAPTGFVPSDAIDLTEWPTFTLTGEEIASLVASAPAELRSLLGSGTTASDVVSLTFEYRSVALNRPWFNPKVFRARCWKFDAGDPPLSDGAAPPSGRCPAYIAALVLARNINVVTRQAGGGVQHMGWRSIPALAQTELQIVPPQHLQVPAHVMELHRPADAIKSAPRLLLQHAGPFGLKLAGVTGVVSPPPATTDIRRAAFSRLAAADFRVVATTVLTTPPHTTPPASDTPPSDTGTRDQVSVLAMICRRLPRSPDPDPALRWS
jgi:hypothetical protein